MLVESSEVLVQAFLEMVDSCQVDQGNSVCANMVGIRHAHNM